MTLEIIKIKKPELYTKELEFELDTNEFYGKFYNSSNQEIYLGGFVTNEKIIWIKIDGNNVNIEVYNKINGGVDSLILNIKKALQDYHFIEEITKDRFIRNYKHLLDNIKLQ